MSAPDDTRLMPGVPDMSIQWCVEWLNLRRWQIHERDCTVHQPSAQCSCGLHRVLSILRMAATEYEPGVVSGVGSPKP